MWGTATFQELTSQPTLICYCWLCWVKSYAWGPSLAMRLHAVLFSVSSFSLCGLFISGKLTRPFKALASSNSLYFQSCWTPVTSFWDGQEIKHLNRLPATSTQLPSALCFFLCRKGSLASSVVQVRETCGLGSLLPCHCCASDENFVAEPCFLWFLSHSVSEETLFQNLSMFCL